MFPGIVRLTAFLVLLGLAAGCSNVKVALYDPKKRKEYAEEAQKAYAATSAGKDAQLRKDMITTAEKYLGTRYKYTGTDPKQGFDCSGFVQYVGKHNGVSLPHSSRSIAVAGKKIPWKSARPGDLMIFGLSGRIEHVALIKKNDETGLWCVHATTQRGVISENVLVSPYWKKRLMHAVDLSSFN
jgi:cell wall-associated NlpC family hydrolase